MERKDDAIRKLWARRIVAQSNVEEKEAKTMAKRILELIRFMKKEEAFIAYRKRNGEFRLVKATLRNYESFFQHKLDIEHMPDVVAYWNVENQSWSTFRMESFLEWKPLF